MTKYLLANLLFFVSLLFSFTQRRENSSIASVTANVATREKTAFWMKDDPDNWVGNNLIGRKVDVAKGVILPLAYKSLPGRIEAEAYDDMSKIRVDNCSDIGGGKYVGLSKAKDWMDYNVNVASAGTYTFNLRVAGFGGQFQLRNSAGQTLTTVSVPKTGGWQLWTTTTVQVSLPVGNQTLRIFVIDGDWNLNWFEFLSTTTTQQTQSVISFGALPDKTVGDAPYELTASSNNTETPITYSSSNPAVVSVSNSTGKWLATPVAAGTATITASQAGSTNYKPAADVAQTQVVKAAPVVGYKALPGRIEAEAYDAMSGIQTENTGDVGGGLNVGYTDGGDWMDYNVNVASVGTYTVNLRAAGFGGRVELRAADGTVLTAVDMPNTGNWQTYTTVSRQITLNAGTQTLRLFSVAGMWNLNWFEVFDPANNPTAPQAVITFTTLPSKTVGDPAYELTASSNNTETPITYSSSNPAILALSYSGVSWKATPLTAGTVTITASQGASLNYKAAANVVQTQVVNPNPTSFKVIPGRIEAEAYDAMQGIATDHTTDAGGGLIVGWMDPGDWMDYNVTVSTAATYTFNLRIAGFGGQVQIRNVSGTVLSTIDLPTTGGWQTWTTVSASVALPAGNQTLRFYVSASGWNFNWFEGISPGGTTATQESVISFAPLPDKMIGDVPFALTATSSNTQTPITYTSSNASVVSVSNASGQWMATLVGIGTATITASQAGNLVYKPAENVAQTQVVKSPLPPSGHQKIPIDPLRWYQLNSNTNTLAGFFDGSTDVGVQIQGTKVVDNYDAYYPLQDGEEITLDGIKFFDGYGYDPGKPMTLSIIDANWNRIPVATFTGVSYGWTGPDPNQVTVFDLKTPINGARYLVLNMWNMYPTEIELYGTYKAPTSSPTPAPAKSTKLKNMFGVNVYEWNFQDGTTPWQINESKMSVVKNFTAVRHYMDWDRIETIEGQYSYNPTQSGGWNYDAIYERCKAEGIEVLADLKTLPWWLVNTYPEGQKNPIGVPVRYGKDYSDPKSYIEQAKVGFQYIARYGSNSNVDPSLLNVSNGTQLKIGMGVIKYIECDNERDAWWSGRAAYQTAREYAANLSAFYDGHKNSMGPAVGVKNADPSIKVVIAGICTNKDYVKGMIDWCKQYRGLRADGSVDVCWDVINYHYYTFNQNPSRGAAPELSLAASDAKGYVQVAHEQLKGMPVWITEAGYDINQGSPLKAIAIGSKSVLETHADWILRTALLYARNGIDKLFFYQLYDDNINSSSQFASSGLATEWPFARKPAGDYLYQVNKQFGEYAYQQSLSTDPIVDRYSNNGQNMYMLVVGDDKGRTASYTLDLGSSATASIYKPKAGSDVMEVVQVPTQGGKLSVTVTETPQFVVASSAGARQGVVEEPGVGLSRVVVYPNPAGSQVSVEYSSGQEGEVEVRVVDSLGLVWPQGRYEKAGPSLSVSVDLSRLSVGLYVVEVVQGSQRTAQKIIKVQ